MTVLERLQHAARRQQATIVFPEGNDPRILRAAIDLARQEIVRPILLGAAGALRAAAHREGLELPEGVWVVDPATSDLKPRFSELWRARHRGGTLTATEATEAVQDP